MRWPFVPRAQHDAVLADRERIRGERNQFEQDRNVRKAAAKTSARLFKETDAKYVDVCRVNQRLTEDLAAVRRELAAVRKVEESLARQIHEMAQPVEPSDEEVDAAQLRLELDQAEARVKHLEKELDNALGMAAGGILASAPWQPGYQDPKPDKAVSP